MDRRGFFKQTAGSVAAAAILPWGELLGRPAVRTPDAIRPLLFRQTVDEILVVFDDAGHDVAAYEPFILDFYRANSPSATLLRVALNPRSTFRWVASPGGELVIAAGDRLQWRQTTAGLIVPLLVQTVGRNDAGDQVLNQTDVVNR